MNIKRLIYKIRLNKHLKVRDKYLWTSFLNKENILLEEPITRKLIVLTDDHLQNIVEFMKERTPKFIYDEILLRKLYPIFSNTIEYK